MNERIRIDPELTARRQYSTLDTRSTMAQDGNNEQPPRGQRQPNRTNPEQLTQRLRVESIGEMMRTANPQAAREAARAIIDAAQASGQTLTPEQRKLVTELGYEPVIAGGADDYMQELEELRQAWIAVHNGRKPNTDERNDIFRQFVRERVGRQGGRKGQEPSEPFTLTDRVEVSQRFEGAKARINEFSNSISQTGFNYETFVALRNELHDARNDNQFEVGTPEWKKFQEDGLLLGMTLSRILRESPSVEVGGDKVENIIKELTGAMELANTEQSYERIEALVNGLEINSGRGEYEIELNAMVRAALENGRRDVAEYILESSMEKFFVKADENPQEAFPQPNFVQQQNLDGVFEAARHYDEDTEPYDTDNRKFYLHLTEIKNKRQIVHELFRGMKDPERYKGGIADYLRKEGLAFVEDEIFGTTVAQRFYERVLGQKLAFKKGWLTENDFVEVDKRVRNVMNEEFREGKVKRTISAYGKEITRRAQDWEIRRGWAMGRAMVGLSQRRIAYTVMGDVPENTDEFLRSVDQELIARSLATLKLIPERFFAQPAAKEMLGEWMRLLKEKNSYGIDGQGIYGKSLDAQALIDTGCWDIKSNSWRSRLLFLKQEEYQTEEINGERYSIGEYLDLMKLKAKKDAKSNAALRGMTEEEIDHALHKHGSLDSDTKRRFNESIRGAIKNQRLFLGVLMRYPDLDVQNKEAIWKNLVQLNPSRIASFMPQEALRITKLAYPGKDEKQLRQEWDRIADKLFLIEEQRVQEDAMLLTRRSGDPFSGTKELKDYYRNWGVTKEEEAVIEGLISYGLKNSAKFAKLKFVLVSTLDDVPRTGWNNLGSTDIARAVNDQGSFNEGLSAATTVIDNPAIRQEDFMKQALIYFEKLKSPMGLEDTQARFEDFLKSWLHMVKMYPHAKHLPFQLVKDMLRQPESLAEKFNLQSDIAFDDHQLFGVISACAQKEMLSDDLTELDAEGRTQFMRIREEEGVDIAHLWVATFRLFFYLFGAAYALEVVKVMFPSLKT